MEYSITQEKITYQVAQMVLETLCEEIANKPTEEINVFLNEVQDENLRIYFEKQIISKIMSKQK